jgi:hypothetical protein
MVYVDLVGQFTTRTPAKTHFPLLAVKMIVPAINTGWFEIDNESMNKLKLELKQMCIQENHGIKAKPTTSHNLKSISKCNH